jgi:hypothetical protein
MSRFTKTIHEFIQVLKQHPELLRKEPAESPSLRAMKIKLQAQGDPRSQGSGNAATNQEACFAHELEAIGFTFQTNITVPDYNGLYYAYQVNGTQRAIDFQAYEWENEEKTALLNFDLKHTKTATFFLNDGWFNHNIVYIVSWMRQMSQKRARQKILQPETFVGLGQDIPIAEEIALYTRLREIKQQCNSEFKGVGSFHSYLRFANTYTCDRFTPEFDKICLEHVQDYIASLCPEHHSSSSSSSSMSPLSTFAPLAPLSALAPLALLEPLDSFEPLSATDL